MPESVKKNFVYQILYQILISILPFVTSPYIARVIGAEGIGIYSYTYSIAYYFVLFGNLGIGIYGNRLIARTRNDREQMNRAFSSLFVLHLTLFLFVILVYSLYVIFYAGIYREYAWIQILYLISYTLDISWLYFGLEQFKLTVTRNSFVKILTVISVFIFVRNGDDLWKYVLVLALGHFMGQILLWSFFRKYAAFSRFSIHDALAHIKPLFTLFFATIAVSIYSYLDKIMIGAISSPQELGYYENAWKLIEFPAAFVTALGTVMLPRISNLMVDGNEEKIKQYVFKSLRFSILAAIAIMFGLLCIADDFSVIFWGEDFARSGTLMKILSATVLFMAWSGVVRQEYLIPKQKDKIYLLSVCVGACLNVILNALLIPQYGSVGASIGTVISYFGIFLVQNISAKKDIDFKSATIQSVPYIITAFLMLIVVTLYSNAFKCTVLNLIIEIVIGVFVFLSCSFIYAFIAKDRFVLDSINIVLTKFNCKQNQICSKN